MWPQLQLRLCEMVSPGVDYVDIHRKAHLGIAALLSASGLVSGLPDEAVVEQGITRAFFPHGIGHFLGIQVHDVAGKPTPSPEDAPFLRLTRTLEAGMVVIVKTRADPTPVEASCASDVVYASVVLISLHDSVRTHEVSGIEISGGSHMEAWLLAVIIVGAAVLCIVCVCAVRNVTHAVC